MMLTLTVEEALYGRQETGTHYLYLYCDGDVFFYVGKSIDPLERLQQHMGLSTRDRGVGSLLGQTIKHCLPESLTWRMEIYTLEDCLPLVQKHLPDSFPLYVRGMQFLDEPLFPRSYLMDTAEIAMIRHYTPSLNSYKGVGGNAVPKPLPDKYQVNGGIANAGVKLPWQRERFTQDERQRFLTQAESEEGILLHIRDGIPCSVIHPNPCLNKVTEVHARMVNGMLQVSEVRCSLHTQTNA